MNDRGEATVVAVVVQCVVEENVYLSGESFAGHLWDGDPHTPGPVAGFRVLYGWPTGGTVLRGELERTTVERIRWLCRKYCLAVDVVLRDRHGRVREVGFVDGEAEPSELVAHEFDTWAHGTYEVKLRPMFRSRDRSTLPGEASE